MKVVNDRMITLGFYFEVHDAKMYGGKGSVGYANTNVDCKISVLADKDISELAETLRQGVADMCEVDKEKVINISRSEYENENEDEDCEDEFDDFIAVSRKE